MTRLGVNVDHVATVREARGIDVPDPVEAAHLAERSGADGIVLHLRKDRRHVQPRDLQLLGRTVKTSLNLEMAVTEEMIDRARDVGPDQVTLVPEDRQELTTEGGLDVRSHPDTIARAVEAIGSAGIRVSLFMDPDPDQLEAAADTGAHAVELHTGDYAETPPRSEARRAAIDRLDEAARTAADRGFEVYAGHGLNYRNVGPVASLAPVEELNIGHALVARAVMVGIEQATRTMKRRIHHAEHRPEGD